MPSRPVKTDKLKPAYAMDTVSYNLGRAISPLVVLRPALDRHLHVSSDLSNCFIAALGAGTVFGSVRKSAHEPSM